MKKEILWHIFTVLFATILGTCISILIFWATGWFDRKTEYEGTCTVIEMYHYEDQKMVNTYSKVVFDDIDHVEESDDHIIIYLKYKEEK